MKQPQWWSPHRVLAAVCGVLWICKSAARMRLKTETVEQMLWVCCSVTVDFYLVFLKMFHLIRQGGSTPTKVQTPHFKLMKACRWEVKRLQGNWKKSSWLLRRPWSGWDDWGPTLTHDVWMCWPDDGGSAELLQVHPEGNTNVCSLYIRWSVFTSYFNFIHPSPLLLWTTWGDLIDGLWCAQCFGC